MEKWKVILVELHMKNTNERFKFTLLSLIKFQVLDYFLTIIIILLTFHFYLLESFLLPHRPVIYNRNRSIIIENLVYN